MSLYIEISPGVFEEWLGQVIDGVRYPANWPYDDLVALGLVEPEVPAVPEGKRVVSQTVQRVAGEVKFVYVLEDMSEDELYPPLEKWKFWAVVELAGLKDALLSVLDGLSGIDPTFAVIARAKLDNPPGGLYYRSDALFHNAYLQMQLEMTDEEINELWTQALALT